jgi:hypothetical protein
MKKKREKTQINKVRDETGILQQISRKNLNMPREYFEYL